MSAVITPTSALSQLVAAAEAAPEIVLQPGAVIDARVLAVRDNLARILIAGLSVEVLTEVALQPGANLKLAVSQTADGTVRLAIVDHGATREGQAAAPSSGTSAATSSRASAPSVDATALPRIAAASLVPASPEALAISQVVQTSAPRQGSLAPLFANLPVIVASNSIPQPIQSAAAQLLATRPPLDGALTGEDLRQAFQKSGLFLEATLGRGAAPAGTPDLKAALVVFKQVLTSWLGQVAPTGQFSPGATPPIVPAATGSPQPRPQAVPQNPVQAGGQLASGPLAPSPAPALAQKVEPASAAALRPQIVPGTVEPPHEGQARESALPSQVLARELAKLSGEIVRGTAAQVLTRDAQASPRASEGHFADELDPRPPAHPAGQMIAARQAAEPSPPFRGAMPSPQPIAPPSLAPDAAPASMGQQLLEQTDAALARQTLLQVASLPDRPELGGANQSTQPRWSFEIPFATPHGTAVAQFEIERDGGNDVEAAAPSRIWRARFTLDVEPTGPVHALVSLIGDKTAVRMWAERPETAAQLRANTEALGQALRQAELEPGDILVGEGAPPQPKPRAGRFLDRAT